MPQENEMPVTDQGAGLTTYVCNPDAAFNTAADTYTAGNTFQKADQFKRVWVTVQNYNAHVSLFTDAVGTALEGRVLLPGVYEFNFRCYGGKIKNATAGQNAVYQIVWER